MPTSDPFENVRVVAEYIFDTFIKHQKNVYIVQRNIGMRHLQGPWPQLAVKPGDFGLEGDEPAVVHVNDSVALFKYAELQYDEHSSRDYEEAVSWTFDPKH